MYSGPLVSLQQVLDGREQRVERQREWLAAHSLPLVSFTINMPGEVKLNLISRIAFELGYAEIHKVCNEHGASVVHSGVFTSDCGHECLITVSGITVEQLKKRMVTIEDNHPLGRLFDIDVLNDKGIALSRSQFGHPSRKCLLCGNDAKVCARSRVHPLPALIDKMCEMINDCN